MDMLRLPSGRIVNLNHVVSISPISTSDEIGYVRFISGVITMKTVDAIALYEWLEQKAGWSTFSLDEKKDSEPVSEPETGATFPDHESRPDW